MSPSSATRPPGSATPLAALVEKSQRIASLQEPLAHRADLPTPLATKLCSWASAAIKAYLVEQRRLDPAIISVKVDEAARAVITPPIPDSAANGRKLVEKLAIAGQLKPGFLLRVLQQGQTELFDLAFARLLEIEITQFREIFYRRGPRPVALACRAVGIDRCVFPTVYNVSRQARSINPILSQQERAKIDAVFGSYTRREAADILTRYPRT